MNTNEIEKVEQEIREQKALRLDAEVQERWSINEYIALLERRLERLKKGE